MRAASHFYLTQAGRHRGGRQTRPGAHPRAAYQSRHADASRRSHPRRELPAVARRVFAALGGTRLGRTLSGTGLSDTG